MVVVARRTGAIVALTGTIRRVEGHDRVGSSIDMLIDDGRD